MGGRKERRADGETEKEVREPSGDQFTGGGEMFLERGRSQTNDRRRAKWVAALARSELLAFIRAGKHREEATCDFQANASHAGKSFHRSQRAEARLFHGY